jgi:hypothetical protein
VPVRGPEWRGHGGDTVGAADEEAGAAGYSTAAAILLGADSACCRPGMDVEIKQSVVNRWCAAVLPERCLGFTGNRRPFVEYTVVDAVRSVALNHNYSHVMW